MALPPGWNWHTGDARELAQIIFNNLSRSNRPPQFLRKFWTKSYQKQYNQSFKILQFNPTETAPINDLDRAMVALHDDLTPTIETLCQEWHGIKVWPVLFVLYESANPLDEHFKNFDAHLTVAYFIFLHYQPKLYANRISPHYPGIQRLAQRLLEANAMFIRGQSGLVLAEIYSLKINVVRFAPFSGSAYTPLPKFLQNRKEMVKVQNHDNRCFGYAIASALHPIQHGNHPTRPENNLQYFEEHRLNDIEYPVNTINIPQLEEWLNLSINLFGYFDDNGTARHPMHISRYNSPIQIDLLYFNGHCA